MTLASLAFYVMFVASQCFTNIWLSLWSTDPLPINGTVNTSLRNLRLGVYGGLGLVQGKECHYLYCSESC
jgi:hypothetical protein